MFTRNKTLVSRVRFPARATLFLAFLISTQQVSVMISLIMYVFCHRANLYTNKHGLNVMGSNLQDKAIRISEFVCLLWSSCCMVTVSLINGLYCPRHLT